MVLLLSIAAVSLVASADAAAEQTSDPPRNACIDTVNVDGFVIEHWTYNSRDIGDSVHIKHGDKTIKVYDGYYCMTVYAKGRQTAPDSMSCLTPYPGVPFDFDGDGHDEIVVGTWTGGAHCCFGAIVLSTFGALKELGTVNFGDGDLNRLRDLDKDGRPEFEMYDWTFGYWHTDFASSPAPRVVVGFRDGRFAAVPELMRNDLPTDKEWKTLLAARVGADDPVAWRPMLALVYSGHGDLAWTLLDAIWPGGGPAPKDFSDWPSKAAFKSDFLKQLKRSPYWDTVKAMNGW